MAIVRNFNLFLSAGHSVPLVINANQYDQGESWVFTLFNSDGTQYIPETGAIVGIKSDGLGIINSGSVVDGKVVITETQQMTAAPGKAVFELMIDNGTHGTANFIVMVEPKPGNNADLSESDLSLLEEAINATSPLPTGGTVGQVLTKTANGSTWSDAGTPTQEQVADAVSDWADEHITVETGVVIDTSLAVAGAAADSKKVGDEITDLKSAITLNNNNGIRTFFGNGNFEHYGLNVDGSFVTAQKYRVSTNVPISFDYDIVVTCANGFRWGYIPVNGGTIGTWNGWFSQQINLPAGTVFYVQIARVTENTGEIANVNEFLSALTFKTYENDLFTNRTIVSESASEYGITYGTIGETGHEDASTTRARTTEFLDYESTKQIKCADYNYKFGLHFYDEYKNHISYTTWINSPLYTIGIVANCAYIKIVFAKRNDTVLSDADITAIGNIYSAISGDSSELLGNALKEIDSLNKEVFSANPYQYEGIAMPSKVYTFDFTTLFRMSYSNMTPQDIECFGDYIFVAFSGNEVIRIYNADTYALISEVSAEVNHGSGMQFSDEYYNSDDPLPLLYVGGYTDNIINVIRIANTGGVWSAQTIRKLYIPTEHGYFMAPSISGQSMYCYGYKTPYYYDPTDNYMILLKCDLSKLTNNGNGTYTPEITMVSKSPYLGIMQGRKYYGGVLYVGFANNASPYNQKIYGIEADTGNIVTKISMSEILESELEGLCYRIVDKKINWIVTDYYNVVELDF